MNNNTKLSIETHAERYKGEDGVEYATLPWADYEALVAAELKERSLTADKIAEIEQLKCETEAKCASWRQHWQTARDRVMANFGHVPEIVRAVEWMQHEMHDCEH